MPKQICSKCLHNLNAFFQFKQTCLKSEVILKQNLIELNENKSKDSVVLPIIEEEVTDDIKEELIAEEKNVIKPDKVKIKKQTEKNISNIKKSSKPHQCEICGRFLSCHSNLVQHLRRHTGTYINIVLIKWL